MESDVGLRFRHLICMPLSHMPCFQQADQSTTEQCVAKFILGTIDMVLRNALAP